MNALTVPDKARKIVRALDILIDRYGINEEITASMLDDVLVHVDLLEAEGTHGERVYMRNQIKEQMVRVGRDSFEPPITIDVISRGGSVKGETIFALRDADTFAATQLAKLPQAFVTRADSIKTKASLIRKKYGEHISPKVDKMLERMVFTAEHSKLFAETMVRDQIRQMEKIDRELKQLEKPDVEW
jgi:hypothetical protein